ncbi:Hint domain-containing protein [Acidisoma sp. 7E03]
MTDRLFQGSQSDWFSAGSWDPPGVPQTGDTLTITSGTALITAADVANNPTIDGEQLWIGSTDSITPAGLAVDGATFGPQFAMGDAGAGYTALSFSGDVTYAGSMDFATYQGSVTLGIAADQTGADTLALAGTVSVSNGDNLALSGGTLDLSGAISVEGGSLDAGSTALTGAGTITVGQGGTVAVGGATSGVTLDFADASGTIDLTDPLGFTGSITSFVTGDTIDLIDAPSLSWSYNWNTGILAVYGGNASHSNPLVAKFALASNTPLSSQQIFVGSAGNGGSLILLATPRMWNGGGGDWYQTGNWTTEASTAPNSYPLIGDTAIITAGAPTITAADSQQFGPLDNEVVQLSGDGAGLTLIEGALGPDLTLNAAAANADMSLTIGGTVTSEAQINVTGAGSTLNLAIVPDGTIAGDLSIGLDGSIVIGSEAALALTAGHVTNDGQIIDDGAMTIASGTTLDGSGVVAMDYSGLTLTVAGTVGAGQQIAMYEDQLTIAQGASFAGIIEDFGNGDTIDLQGVAADYVAYDQQSSQLIVKEGGATGQVVASLTVTGDYGPTDFAVQSDGNGGVFITDTVTATSHNYYATLPVPALVAPGQSISLQDLLVRSFGSVALSLPSVALYSQSAADMQYFSYWDPSDPSLPYWVQNGTILTPDNLETIQASDFANVYYVGGNAIQANAGIEIPIAFDSGTPVGTMDYNIQNFGSAFAQPSLGGAPTPQDVVNAASAFAAAYTGAANTEDCYNIAHEVAAAAGATMQANTGSTDPEDNVAGGFWRIAYAAPQDDTAVSNWSTMVLAGDIMRIGWASNGGPHSFTILAPLDANGSITVFDNVYFGDGYEAIGIHQVTYWTQTDPNDITIFRLDPNDLYLVDTTKSDGTLVQNLASATTFGTQNNDLIIPAGPSGTISCGGGTDVIADTSALLNGATILGFGIGDTLDFTDLVYSATSISYDEATGACEVTSAGSVAAELFLPLGLSGNFVVSNDGGSLGLDGNTLGTIYSSLFVGPTQEGSAITFVTCFAAGTRIKTARGDVAVETLAVDDEVVCAEGLLQPIVWIGRRVVDVAHHPEPEAVLPVRIAAHAFGPDLPVRPLFLSPDHAIYAEGVLIPVRYLVNGRTVARQPQSRFPEITYFHVELPEHAVILAEDLPVESYLDTGNRHSFGNGGAAVALFPDFSPLIWDARGCAPLVVTGPELARVRARLDRQAESAAARGKRRAVRRV